MTIQIGINPGTKLKAKKTIKAEFIGGTYLFDDIESGREFPIYTSSPAVSIAIDDGEINHQISMVIRNRDSGYKKTIEIDDIECMNISEDEVNFDCLDVFDIERGEFGRYSLKFYEKGLYKKELDFAYIPVIEYNDELVSKWPNEKGLVETTALRYKTPQNAEIEITSKVSESIEEYNGELWHLLKTREPEEYLEGKIRIGKAFNSEREQTGPGISFRKRVRNLQWSIHSEADVDFERSGEKQKVDIGELKKTDYWMSFSMKKPEEGDESFIMLLSSEGEIIQEQKIKPNARGKWQINVNVFEESMKDRKLPLSLLFRMESETEKVEFPLVEIYEKIILKNLMTKNVKVKNNDGGVEIKQALTWQLNNIDYESNNLEIVDMMNYASENVRIQNVKKGKNKEGKYFSYMKFDEKLKNGLYKIEYGENDFFEFEEEGFEPPVLSQENTFYVGDKNSLIEKIKEKTISSLIEAIMINYKRENNLVVLCELLGETDYSGSVDENHLKQMIVLARFAICEKKGSCEKLIIELLGDISERISEQEREKLLDIIINAELKDEEKKEIITLFNLLYAVVSDASQEKIESIMMIDTFLGTRSVLKCTKNQCALQSLTSGLGIDIMKEMMNKQPDGSIKIEATYEMFGNTDDFYNMFDWGSFLKQKGYTLPKLDTSKKPEETLVFWGDSFVNLLEKWYFRNLGKYDDLIEEAESVYKKTESTLKASMMKKDKDIDDYLKKATLARELTHATATRIYTLIAASPKVGMLFALYDMGKIQIPSGTIKIMKYFVAQMNVIFPELIKRDILMAELFLYLKEV